MRKLTLLGLLLTTGCIRRYPPETPPSPIPARDALREQRELAVGRWAVVADAPLDYWKLGDGRLIDDPRELRQLVAPDSATARAITAWDSHDFTRLCFGWSGAVAEVVGLVLVLVAALDPGQPYRNERLVTGGVLATGGLISVGVLAPYFNWRAKKDRAEIREHYPADLRAWLLP
jgi:hypothetical protein